jgi:hypothetical protein
MSAKILGLIPVQTFEMVRDQVAAILAVELANQLQYDSTLPIPSKVYIERFIPFDANTEMPAVNVNFWKVEFKNKTVVKSEGDMYLNIDIYNASNTIGGVRGDQLASVALQRLAGICRGIVQNPEYYTLNLPGLVGRTGIEGIYVTNKSVIPDALNETVCRIVMKVLVYQSEAIYAKGVPLNEITMTAKINQGTNGIFYDVVSLVTDNNGNYLLDTSGNNIINAILV